MINITKQEFILKYWKYYLSLEKDFMSLERYISFDEKNYETFSIEFIKQYQSICSEIDAIFKLIAKGKKMDEYRKFLLDDEFYKKIKDEKVTLVDNEKIILSPFSDLNYDKSIDWWTNYNGVKHNRLEENNYINANFKNVLTSLAALYILELYFFNRNFYYPDEQGFSIPINASSLFVIKKLYVNFDGLVFLGETLTEWKE